MKKSFRPAVLCLLAAAAVVICLGVAERVRAAFSEDQPALSRKAVLMETRSGAADRDSDPIGSDGASAQAAGEMTASQIHDGETAPEPEPVRNVVPVPILMYHAFTEESGTVSNGAVVSVRTFEDQLRALQDAGYTSVRVSDLIKFVYDDGTLPEKPILLTADDGYLDNLTLAAPLLEQYGFSMSVAVIGCSVGKSTYKDTGAIMRAHFSLEEAKPWVDAGVVEILSHTYDMHQIPSRDGCGCRIGVQPLAGETEEDYRKALFHDLSRSKGVLEQGLGVEVRGLVYPHGYFTADSEEVAESLGFRVTMTIEPGTNRVIRGAPHSLQLLSRNWVTDSQTGELLLELLESFS